MLHIATFNRWWITGNVDKIYLKPYKRDIFHTIVKKFLNARQILLIYGLRRVGKTTLMYQLINHLLQNKIDKKHIFYFSFDDQVISLEKLMNQYCEEILNNDLLKEKKIFIFLDEIQKLNNWQEQLKIFYDLYPNVKFIVSGSASGYIAKKAKESLAGRMYEFTVHLVSFFEYLTLHNVEIEPINDISNIKELKRVYIKKDMVSPLFYHYLKTGGFIEVVGEKDELKLQEYSKSIIEKVIFTDIPISFKIKHPYVLNTIVELVSSNPGFLLDYSKLSKIVSMDPRVVADYVFYLQHSFIIKLLYNFSGSFFVSERKLKKAYVNSINFMYRYNKDKFFDHQFVGKVVENLVVVNSDSRFFWKERNVEVDIINSEKIPIEVKYRNSVDKNDIKPIIKFAEKFKIKKSFIVTKDLLDSVKESGLEITFIPCWLYLLSNKM